ncbi:MAG TPA: protein kinase [Vicinamibacterales bacterium]
MVGQTIGKYRVVEQIGRGGMGTVYKAIDETLDRRVALKLLNADLIDQDAVERFRREAMMLAKLNHGRIGAIHELTRDGHDLLMVMEYLEGETFEKLIERGPMAVPRAISLVSQVLDALEYAHGVGVIHRDLKPANLMLSPSGEVKVMDFGIARVQGSEHLTTNGYMVGTPAYMAPEQVRGEEVDPRMDLYSVAVVLYRMLTHHLPFHGDTAIAMIHSQLNNPPTPPQQFRADLPEWLVNVLERGLAKKPADRFQDAREFRVALERGLTGKMPIVKPPTGTIPTPSRPLPSPPATRNIPGLGALEGTPLTSTQTGSAAPSPTALPSPSAPRAEVAVSQVAAAPQSSANATVTLKPRHLATAAALVLALVVGGGVLAFIALRRPTTVILTAPQADTQSTAPANSSTAPAPSSGAVNPEPAPAASTHSAPTSTDTQPTPATSPAAASAPAPASSAPAKPAAASAPGTSTPTTPRGSAATGNATASSAAPATPAAPAAASAPAENFGDIKAMVFEGSKSREVDALLSLEPGNLIVRSKSDGAVLRTVPYRAIAAATYARGRKPRGQTLPGASNIPDDVGGSGIFGGARHWLTLQTANDYVIIRLEDRNVIAVLNGLEARTGNKVTRSQG